MTYDQFFIVTLSLTMAGVIVYFARHWLQPRKQGENFSEFAQRIAVERQAYQDAIRELTNSQIKRTNALFTQAMLIGLIWLLLHVPYWRWIAVGYVVIGAALATRLFALPSGWGILTSSDRVWWRITRAWYWPFLVIQKFRKPKEV
jgi:hypothetical protein